MKELIYIIRKRAFVKRWRRKNRSWRECRHKKRCLKRALIKAGFINANKY